jgi:hypothetical protein
MIQKGLAFRRERSGSVTVPGANSPAGDLGDNSGSVENAIITAHTEANNAACAGASCSTILQKWLATTVKKK